MCSWIEEIELEELERAAVNECPENVETPIYIIDENHNTDKDSDVVVVTTTSEKTPIDNLITVQMCIRDST